MRTKVVTKREDGVTLCGVALRSTLLPPPRRLRFLRRCLFSARPRRSAARMLPDSDDAVWARTDKTLFALYGALFTLGMDAVVYPFEAIKTRIQVETKADATLVESMDRTIRTTLRADGVRGLYRGFAMFTFGGLPSQG